MQAGPGRRPLQTAPALRGTRGRRQRFPCNEPGKLEGAHRKGRAESGAGRGECGGAGSPSGAPGSGRDESAGPRGRGAEAPEPRSARASGGPVWGRRCGRRAAAGLGGGGEAGPGRRGPCGRCGRPALRGSAPERWRPTCVTRPHCFPLGFSLLICKMGRIVSDRVRDGLVHSFPALD